MRKLEVSCLVAFACSGLLIGCGGSEERPPQNGPVGQYTPQQNQQQQPPPQQTAQNPQQGQAGQAGAAGQAPQGPIGPILSDPNALQTIISGALSGTAAALGAVTGGEIGPIQAGIKASADSNAKGMQPVGELMSAKLQTGGHAQGSLTMEPGACYTIVGFGGLGVFSYQMNLITAPPLPPQVLAQSPAGSVNPVIGPNDQCIRTPSPLPLMVKIDMQVLNGQGTVGAQVYKK